MYCLQRPAEPFGNAATHNPGCINVGEEIGFLSEQGNGLTIRATPQMCPWASITVTAASLQSSFPLPHSPRRGKRKKLREGQSTRESRRCQVWHASRTPGIPSGGARPGERVAHSKAGEAHSGRCRRHKLITDPVMLTALEHAVKDFEE